MTYQHCKVLYNVTFSPASNYHEFASNDQLAKITKQRNEYLLILVNDPVSQIEIMKNSKYVPDV